MAFSQSNPLEETLHIIKTVSDYAGVLNDLECIDAARKNLLAHKTPLSPLYAQSVDQEMRAKHPEIQAVNNIVSWMSYHSPVRENTLPKTSEELTLENLENDGKCIIAFAAVKEGVSPTIEDFIQKVIWNTDPQGNFVLL